MGYKITNTFKKSKTVLIIMSILWLILSILFVAPVTVGITEGTVNGKFLINDCITITLSNMTSIGSNLGKVFTSEYIGTFGKVEGYFSIFLLFFAVIGFFKSMPKNEYTDIEHGSSDWSAGGEQYKVLSPKKGILLAEKHFLPVDKRGNTNVLVVGRIWISENLHLMLYQMLINY